MTLTELYARTPPAQHGSIIVTRGRVYLRSAEGTEEFILWSGGELELVRSDKANPLGAMRQDLAAIKAKLGA